MSKLIIIEFKEQTNPHKLHDELIIILPIHPSSIHSCVSIPSSSQSLPPKAGTGSEQVRLLVTFSSGC